MEKWGPTAKYLSTRIPDKKFVIVPIAFEQIYAFVEKGKVDFILANSSFYVELEHWYGANRIATLKNLRLDGAYTEFAGVIFWKANRADLRDLMDLKGKTLMAVKETSFGGWRMAWRELKGHGIDPYHHFKALSFGGTHDAVVYAVRDGIVDAGTVRTDTLERMQAEGKIDVKDLYVIPYHGEKTANLPFLHSTRAYPEWPMAKVRHTPDALAEKVAIALLEIPADSNAAKAAKCAGWTIPLNYQSVHDCLKELKVGPYKDLGKITLSDVIRNYWHWILAFFVLFIGTVGFTGIILKLNRNINISRRELESEVEERKKAEKAVKENERRVKTILDTVNAGILVIDPETRTIVEANPAAGEMIGCSRQELVGKGCHKYICPSEEGQCPIVDLGQDIDNSERILLTAGGNQVSILKTVAPVILDGKKHLLESFVDISERKRIENVLQEAKKSAEAANRAKSAFLANMSHELRTPLNAVLGFSQLMRNDPSTTETQRENLEIINRSGEHLLTLINDVLDMSKIEAGRTILESEDFDLGELVRDITDMMRVRAEGKGLQLVLDQTSEFPRFIHGDAAKLRQIFINLVSNAVKFTDTGGVTLRLDAMPAEDDSELILRGEVEDTGSGIVPEDLERIFTPFEQLAESATQKGTGLGLAITRQFIEMMGGEITAKSEPGKGSLFRFTLQVQRAQDIVTAKVATETRRIIGLEPDQPSWRILIVEDQLENRLLLKKLLEQVGFEVHEAVNGQEAIDVFEAWRPHFIWMDRRMPVMDGLTATRRIKAMESGKETIIVTLTASVFEEQRGEVVEAGCDDFLRKPFREAEIFDMMAKHLKVRYVYAEEQPTTTAEAARMDLPSSEAMAALPPEWLAVLARAAEEIDLKAAEQIISRIGGRDKALAESLSYLVKDFRFDTLQDLIKRLGNSTTC
ncbi:MAG: PhnD/SsuA/transferrin family substrate-binding protein [Deltaproteobacteria bacterium]|nr:PhnD/SsuA/transferrin family substrate-binding protein [Deltaproteobacteria bacterium]